MLTALTVRTVLTDRCGECIGGSTNRTACERDCAGSWAGNATKDACGTCNGDVINVGECDSLELNVVFSIRSVDASSALAELSSQLADPNSALWSGAMTSNLKQGQNLAIKMSCPQGTQVRRALHTCTVSVSRRAHLIHS